MFSQISTNAFVFAFGSALLIQVLGRLRGTDGQTQVLFGIALFFTFNALVAIMQFIATEQALNPARVGQRVIILLNGDLSRTTEPPVLSWALPTRPRFARPLLHPLTVRFRRIHSPATIDGFSLDQHHATAIKSLVADKLDAEHAVVPVGTVQIEGLGIGCVQPPLLEHARR